jgi:hypothetical protein
MGRVSKHPNKLGLLQAVFIELSKDFRQFSLDGRPQPPQTVPALIVEIKEIQSEIPILIHEPSPLPDLFDC